MAFVPDTFSGLFSGPPVPAPDTFSGPEANHQRLRDQRNIVSYIPPNAGRPSNKPATGAWRRHMQRTLTDAGRKRVRFGQRWQVETVFSMIKRNLGCAVSGRKYWSQCRDLLLLCITHNAMIALRWMRFSTEHS